MHDSVFICRWRVHASTEAPRKQKLSDFRIANSSSRPRRSWRKSKSCSLLASLLKNVLNVSVSDWPWMNSGPKKRRTASTASVESQVGVGTNSHVHLA